MAELHILNGLLLSFTPGSAFVAGLLVGAVIFLTSKVASSSLWMSGNKDQSLHIKLGDAYHAREQDSSERSKPFEIQDSMETGQQDLRVRWWRLDEVVVDESLGIS
jgi:hypothetical protein